MRFPPKHSREQERVAILQCCGVLDTPAEPDFDGLVSLASAIAKTPIALVSLVDEERQWFKAKTGLEVQETARDLAFCAHAILEEVNPFIVPDVRLDERFADNPFVTEGPQIQSYAGIPLLVGPDRLPVGTLCVFDVNPRQLSEEQLAQLQILAHQAERLLELRLRQNALEQRLIATQESEEKIQTIVACMNEGLVVQDAAGTILSCNPAAEEILGLSADQLCGRKSLDPRWRAIYPDGKPFPGKDHPSMVVLRTGEPVSDVLMGVGLDGEETRWISINARPMGQLLDGKPAGCVCTFFDITKFRQEEEQRKRALAQIDRFFSIGLDMLCIAGFDAYFRRLNPAFSPVLGWTTEELMARPFVDLVHPEDLESTAAEVNKLSIGGITIHFENRYKCKDGSWRLLQWNAVGVPDEGIIVAAARDVTVQEEQHKELIQAKEDADMANRAKATFLATMSHEIRTSMHGVLGAADILDHTKLDTTQSDLVAALKISGQSLLGIIENILDWSKIQSRRIEFHLEAVNLREAIEAVIAVLRTTATQKKLTLSHDVSPNLAVLADPLRLRQVLMNVVGNAVKFTKKGGVTIRAFENASKAVTFEVVDTGIGISEEALPLLFTRFTQADASRAAKFSGTGLGLAISLQLTEDMGGSMSVSSLLGQGSTFSVTLPSAVGTALGKTGGLGGPLEESENTEHPLRVLLAEDNAINQKVATLMLNGLGHAVQIVTDGMQVLQTEMRDFDLILMDVQLPVMDGLEATRRIRSYERASGKKRIPIVALTASAQSEQRAACLDAGMDIVLTKPVTRASLSDGLKLISARGNN